MDRLFEHTAKMMLQMSGPARWSAEYRLIVIEEEQVPLASGIMSAENPFFIPTLAVMAVLLLATLISIYYFRCKAYRKRLAELKGDSNYTKTRWNLSKLKREVAEAEWNLAEQF